MGLTINIPTPVLVGAGAAVAGIGAGIGLEKLLEPGVEAKIAANKEFTGKLDGFLAQNPVPEGTTLNVNGVPPDRGAFLIGAGGIALAGAGALALNSGVAAKVPFGTFAAIGAIAAGVGALAGATTSYLAL